MSYAGQTTGVRVGLRAGTDPVLARASLEAANILRKAAERPREARPAAIAQAMGLAYGGKVRAAYERKLQPGANDQAVYDAARMAIADHYVEIGLRYLQRSLKKKHGSRFVPASLGDTDEGKAIGCAVGGGTTALLAAIVGGYTAGAGAAPIGAVGTMAMTAAGCGAEQQAAQGELAATQAAAAQAQLEAARIAAESADRQAAEQRKTMVTAAAVGGGVLLLLGVGYAIIK